MHLQEKENTDKVEGKIEVDKMIIVVPEQSKQL